MMVSFFAGLCDLCGEARPMATPEQRKAAGLDLDAAVCVECVRNANPAACQPQHDASPGPDGVVRWNRDVRKDEVVTVQLGKFTKRD